MSAESLVGKSFHVAIHDGALICTNDGIEVAICRDAMHAHFVVDRLNACVGISDERLADVTRRGESINQTLARLYDEIDGLRGQHDELLSGLRASAAALNQNATFPADVALARKIVAAALT